MKSAFRILGALLLLAGVCFSQVDYIPAPSIAFLGYKLSGPHNVGGVFQAPLYATWHGTILTGNAATGSQSIIVTGNSGGVAGVLSLADGYSVPLAVVFNTNTPIYFIDANAETVTPTAVTIGACPAGFQGVGVSTQCATITASFANTHGPMAPVVSGDAGIEEAITDAGNSGGGDVFWIVDTGIVTLNTGGLTTNTTTKVPSTFYNTGGACRVTTTITTSANWQTGITGATGAFCASQSTLTAGTTAVAPAIALAGTGSTALTTVNFLMGTSNPGAGAIKARVWGTTPVQSNQ